MRYLTQSGFDGAEATGLIFGQNVLGIIMFIIPLILLLLVSGQSLGSVFQIHVKGTIVLVLSAVILAAVVVLTLSKRLRERVKDFAVKFVSQLRDITSSQRELVLAALASFSITICYVGCLFGAIHAFHGTLSIGATILIYAAAMIAKAVVPTPGGLGPVEVAISAALVASGLPYGQSLAIVILYRFASFWLPIPFSVLAYRYISKNNII